MRKEKESMVNGEEQGRKRRRLLLILGVMWLFATVVMSGADWSQLPMIAEAFKVSRWQAAGAASGVFISVAISALVALIFMAIPGLIIGGAMLIVALTNKPRS